MERIGDILVRLGSIEPDSILRAVADQRHRGGSIGTALLEQGSISEDQLAEALAAQHGVPAVAMDELRTVSQETADILDPKVARRCQAVPIRQANGHLVVAMTDPSDLSARDEISFALDRTIETRVAPDFRILEAHDRLYDVTLDERYRRLLDRINRQRYLWNADDGAPDGTSQVPAEPSFSPTDQAPVEIIFDTLDESIFPETTIETNGDGGPRLGRNAELLSIDGLAGLEVDRPPDPPTDSPVAATPPPQANNGGRATPSAKTHEPLPELVLPVRVRSLQDARDHLETVDGVSEIAGVVLGYLDRTFHRTVLFKALADRIAGWTGIGNKVDPRAIVEFELSLREPSIFRDLAEGTSFYLGPLAVMPSHRKLAACWRGEMTPECLLLPIRVRQRLVAVCYVDRGTGGLKQINLDRFQQLAATAGEAMERCILRKKKG